MTQQFNADEQAAEDAARNALVAAEQARDEWKVLWARRPHELRAVHHGTACGKRSDSSAPLRPWFPYLSYWRAKSHRHRSQASM